MDGLRRNTVPASGERAFMPLWRAGDSHNAVGLAVRPDGMLVLERGEEDSGIPALAFLVKETNPDAVQDDL